MVIRKDALYLGGAAAAVAAVSLAVTALADSYSAPEGVPRLIPFRGHLEQGGAPVTSEVSATFTIYDQPSGGNVLWGPESHMFTPHEGAFTVMLGETVPIDRFNLSRGDAYIEIAIAGVPLAGRQRIGSVPYALRAQNGVPAGTVVSFAAEAVPAGWELCDGRALDAQDPRYAELFAAIGTTWGDGTTGTGALPGETDFNLPDLRGEFLRGAHAPSGRDGDGERDVGHHQPDMMQSHRHEEPGHSHAISQYVYRQWAADVGHYGMLANFSGSTNTTATRVQLGDPTDSGSGAGAPRHGVETRPRNVAVNFIIKL